MIAIMNHLVESKDIAVFINDFDQEYADGLNKLSGKLGRPLHGVILIDKEVRRTGRNTSDKNSVFEQIECDFSDDVSLRKTIKTIENRLLLVTCSGERNQPYLQKALPHMPYILGPTTSSVQWATHKGLMRERIISFDPMLAPHVQTITDDNEEQIRIILTTLTFPLIVKPTGLASSLLVSKVDDEIQLRQVLRRSLAVIRNIYERDGGRGDPGLIIEEFIHGDMYSTDAYVNNSGKVWLLPFLRVKTGYEVGLEDFYMYQTDSYTELGSDELEAGRVAAEKAVHALGLRSCVAHVELYNTKEGWKIIELGPRAGGRRQDIYWNSYGIDHAYNEFLLKVGLQPEVHTTPKAFSSTLKFYPEKEGTIRSIEGVEELRTNPSFVTMKQQLTPGDLALLSSNGGKFAMDCVLCNTDITQLRKDIELARATINIVTEDMPTGVE